MTLPSMLVELSVVEQRYQAVLAVVGDGVPVVEVAARFGVSRQAVHRWLRWYEAQGIAGLADRSHRPPRCSHQMDPAVEVWLLEARRGPPEQGLGMPPRSRIAWGRRPPRDVRSYLDDFGTQREFLIGEDPLIRCILPRYLTAVARKDLGCSEIGFTGSASWPQELPLWQ